MTRRHRPRSYQRRQSSQRRGAVSKMSGYYCSQRPKRNKLPTQMSHSQHLRIITGFIQLFNSQIQALLMTFSVPTAKTVINISFIILYILSNVRAMHCMLSLCLSQEATNKCDDGLVSLNYHLMHTCIETLVKSPHTSQTFV